jgi:hypothetical protein
MQVERAGEAPAMSPVQAHPVRLAGRWWWLLPCECGQAHLLAPGTDTTLACRAVSMPELRMRRTWYAPWRWERT